MPSSDLKIKRKTNRYREIKQQNQSIGRLKTIKRLFGSTIIHCAWNKQTKAKRLNVPAKNVRLYHQTMRDNQ